MSPVVARDSRENADAPLLAKRILLSDPLTSHQADEQLLPKRMALPIFASDALSSVAYAPQELLMIMLVHGVTITLVPWLLDSSELIYGRRSRPIPGQERAGRPVVTAHGRRAQRPAGPPDA